MELKQIKNWFDIDVSNWEFCIFDDPRSEHRASKKITNILKKEFRKTPPEADLVWINEKNKYSLLKNAKKPKDPLTIYFGIPISDDEFTPVYYECSLTKLFKNLTDEWETGEEIGDKYVTKTSLLMANELRKIADHLEKFSIRSFKMEKQND